MQVGVVCWAERVRVGSVRVKGGVGKISQIHASARVKPPKQCFFQGIHPQPVKKNLTDYVEAVHSTNKL